MLPEWIIPTIRSIGLQEHDARPLAMVRRDNHILWAQSRAPQHPLHSALFRLISGIYQSDPEAARSWVRQRIFTLESPSSATEMTVKVAAKRMTWIEGLPAIASSSDHGIHVPHLIATEVGELAPPPSLALPKHALPHSEAIHLCSSWTEGAHVAPSSPRHLRNRAIACVLLDARGVPLAGGTNQASNNPCRHAEIEMLRARHSQGRGPIPRGATVITTLKPCRMCAAMIWESCEDRASIRVIYRDFDPGTNGRATLLDKDSPDRRRYARNAEERDLSIQFKFALDSRL